VWATLRAWIWEVYGNKNAGLEARKATIADSSETFQTVSGGYSRKSASGSKESRGKAPIMSDHRMIEDGSQEAAIGAFLIAHEGHTQDVEVQRGEWSIYCRCTRCEDIHTYEVDNEARERALGLPPWSKSRKRLG
jgi:hypothetical protein